MERTYRITVRGRFDALGDDQRKKLLAEQSDHDMFAARFSPEGTFLYEPSLINFQLRYEIIADEASPVDADTSAELQATERAHADLAHRQLNGTVTAVAMTCVNDLKPRKKKGRLP